LGWVADRGARRDLQASCREIWRVEIHIVTRTSKYTYGRLMSKQDILDDSGSYAPEPLSIHSLLYNAVS
jgi:hypothetical protein